MLTRSLLFLAAFMLLCAGCAQVRQTVAKPVIGPSEGELFIYCEPFSQDAEKLKFTVEAVAAIRDDGQTVPLKQEFNEFQPSELRRQRLFAQGIVPAGRYTGVAFTVIKASLQGEQGTGRLLVQDKPYEVRVAATVRAGKASVITLDLSYRDAVNGASFSPAFNADTPSRPVPELIGYLTNRGSNTITVFDRRSARIGAMIETGRGPAGIAIDQTRMRAYVALGGEDAIAVLDVKENDFVDRIRLNPGDGPSFLALSFDGKLAVTANTGSNTASVVDVLGLAEIAHLPTGNGPEYVVMDRSGHRAFVFNRLSNNITVIDLNLTNPQVLATIATESAPLQGQFNKKGDQLFIAHGMSPNILEIALDTLSQTRKIYAGIGVSALKVNPLTDMLYVGTRFGGIIDIYNPFTLMAGDFLKADGGVGYMTIDGEENNLLVVHPRNRLLSMINLVSKKDRGLVDTGADPYCMAIFGER